MYLLLLVVFCFIICIFFAVIDYLFISIFMIIIFLMKKKCFVPQIYGKMKL